MDGFIIFPLLTCPVPFFINVDVCLSCLSIMGQTLSFLFYKCALHIPHFPYNVYE